MHSIETKKERPSSYFTELINLCKW